MNTNAKKKNQVKIGVCMETKQSTNCVSELNFTYTRVSCIEMTPWGN